MGVREREADDGRRRSTSRAAVTWLDRHASHDSKLLVDNTVWVDLVERGFSPSNTVWFYKLDLDPAVRIPVDQFDYVVLSNYMRGNLDKLPHTQAAVARSQVVAAFEKGNERIEIRRILRPVNDQPYVSAYGDSKREKRG